MKSSFEAAKNVKNSFLLLSKHINLMISIQQKPPSEEYPVYYQIYFDQIPNEPLLKLLESNSNDMLSWIGQLDDAKGDYRYQEGKWTIKEVLYHIMDAERIFAFRALSFARNETAPVPFYDHNAYVEELQIDHLSLQEIMEEFESLRKSTIAFFKNLNETALVSIGKVGEFPMSTRAAGYIIAAHANHHLNVFKQKYS